MRLFTLLLSISVTSLSSSVNAEVPKDKWEGYKPASLVELPPKVKEFAENAVFLMESIEPLPGKKMEIIDLQTDPRAKTKVTDTTVLKDDIVAFQIETCRKQKIRYCPIGGKRIVGTVFFNNNKFYTCRHGFHDWLSAAAEANSMVVSDISPPIVLRIPNKEKPGKFKVVYQSSFENTPMLNFSFINDNPSLNVPRYKGKASSTPNENVDKSDFVEMKISSGKSKLIKDYNLPVKNVDPDKNEEVYAFGYPGKTNYTNLKENNALSGQIYTTHGTVQDYFKDEALFSSSNFSSPGMSGGPVISADGNVVGMTCFGQNHDQASERPEHVNTLFYPLDKNIIEELWTTTGLSYEESQDTTQTSN